MDPTGLGLPPLLAAFVFGLLGGAHCIGMCGGIMSALTFAVPPSMRSPSRLTGLLLGYNLGRIVSYMLAGALVAALGTLLTLTPGMRTALQGFAALMLILMALYIADWWKGLLRVEAVGKRLWRHLEPVGRKLMPVVRIPQAIALGAVWGWLPCGLVYSALLYGLTTESALRGGLFMLFFGLGTLPMLFTVGVMASRVAATLRQPVVRRLAGVAIMLLAPVPLLITRWGMS